MSAQERHAMALQLANAEAALRSQWRRGNLYSPSEEVTWELRAQKKNAHAMIRSSIAEIRLLQWQMAGLTVSAFERLAASEWNARTGRRRAAAGDDLDDAPLPTLPTSPRVG